MRIILELYSVFLSCKSCNKNSCNNCCNTCNNFWNSCNKIFPYKFLLQQLSQDLQQKLQLLQTIFPYNFLLQLLQTIFPYNFLLQLLLQLLQKKFSKIPLLKQLLQDLQQMLQNLRIVFSIQFFVATIIASLATDFSLININSCNVFEVNMHDLQKDFHKKFRFQRWNYKGEYNLHDSLKYC